MKLKLQFGLHNPKRDANWWQQIADFPALVLYKGSKWEFVMYQKDDTGQADYVCTFSEVQTYHPNWGASTYVNIDYMFDGGWSGNCECGAVFSGFPWDHMRYCRKWEKW